MNILIVYANAEGNGRIPLGMAIIATLWKNAGHTVTVFDTTFMKKQNVDSDTRVKLGFVPKVSLDHLYEDKRELEIDMAFVKTLEGVRPDLIAVTVVEENYEYICHFLTMAKSVMPMVPVLAGGPTASVATHIVLNNPNIDYVILGDGESAAMDFVFAMQNKHELTEIENLCFVKNGGCYENPMRPFTDMDDLPIQDYSLWDPRHLIRPYDGKLWKSGFYEMSRGCPNRCTYCINERMHELQRDCGKFYRRKSIDKFILEIVSHKIAYGIERVFINDDNFLPFPVEQIETFAQKWKDYVALPFWINTSPESVSREKLQLIKDAGCDGISMGLESGSEWMRKNILHRFYSNERFIAATDLIHEYGIKLHCNSMIGFPYERESDIQETIDLLRAARAERGDTLLVTPYYGTGIYDLSRQMGLIKTKTEEGFYGFVENAKLRNLSIHIPFIEEEKLLWIRDNMTALVAGDITLKNWSKNGNN